MIWKNLNTVRKFILLISLLSVFLTSSAQRRKVQEDDGYTLKIRGVMESFRSVNDGLEERLQSYAKSGVTHYYYCPSDDKYCNRWGWKFLYGDMERKDLKKCKALCIAKGIDFVWTVNPSDSYSWSKQDFDLLLNKLIIMYYDGVRNFALRLPEDEAKIASTLSALQQDFVARMPQPVTVQVINHIPMVTYPSESDIPKTLMRGYHFDDSFKSKALKAGSIVCRLTQNDDFVGIPIAATMDYAQNPDTYQPDKSIADGLDAMPEDVKAAFLTFLSHTGGVDESTGIETFSLADWSVEKATSLYEEFDKIEKVPSIIEGAASSAILEALSPWLQEFGRLGARGKSVIDCISYFKNEQVDKFWISYIGNMMTPQQQISYTSYPVGQTKLQPFCESMMKEMTESFSSTLTNGTDIKVDFQNFTPSTGRVEYRIPANANTCRLLTGRLPEDEMVIFRQLNSKGQLVAEFVVRSPYTEFDLKEGAVKVDVLGEVDIYETIFVYL
jgi:hypothetical protein